MSKPGILFNELIDQYKLEKHLAQKRVTDHYLAFDVDENNQIAIEILLPFLANQQTYANRFISKIQTVAQLNHPHIAQIYQVGIAPNKRPYFAREHVEGVTLGVRLNELANQEHPVHSIYALKLVRQIADALALAERLDIFHYDLHPDNIIFQADGDIMLVDLGIPRVKKDENDAFVGNINFDTRYWSPEQIQNKSIDARSHVYSIGVILFEILTGHVLESGLRSGVGLPFVSGKSALDKLRPDLSPETIRLVHKCLKSSQWGRFQNCTELLKAIDESIQAEEFVLRSGERVRNRSTTTRLILTVGLPLILLVLATAIGLVLVRNGNSGDSALLENESSLVAGVDETATPTIVPQSPTPTLRPQKPTAVSAAPNIQLISPEPETAVSAQDLIEFSWEWDSELGQNQEFFLFGFNEGEQFIISSVIPEEGTNTYQTAVSPTIFPAGSGQYEWQVVLLNTITRNPVSESRMRSFTLNLLATSTPQPTNTPTPSSTPTNTPTATPVPQVEVTLSSISLRSGPHVFFDIIRFLEFGDVLDVISINPAGDWLNVIADNNTVGWVHISTVGNIDNINLTAIPTAVSIPPIPTITSSPVPTSPPAATATPVDDGGGGGGGGGDNPPAPQPTQPSPPTKTPPPP